MRHAVMSLNRFASINIDRYTYCLSRFGRPAFQELRTMDKNIATFLRVDHAKLTNFRAVMSRHMQQSAVADLSAHFSIKRRLIENDIYLFRFPSRQNGFNNRFRFQKVVSKKFRRRSSQLSFFDTDFLFLLGSAGPLPLLVHQFFETGNIHSQSALTCHQFREIEREPVRVVQLERELSSDFLFDWNSLFCLLRLERHDRVKSRNTLIERLVERFVLTP